MTGVDIVHVASHDAEKGETMNLSDAKSFDEKVKDYRYDKAHRAVSQEEQERPCTCKIKAKKRQGSATYPSLIELVDADPDCELHFPWVIEDETERVHIMRFWFAGYQVGYDTGFTTGEESVVEKMMEFLEIDRD